MEIFIKVLQLIMALSLLVFVHELGHYFTARRFGIRVEKFYLFFDAWGFRFFRFRIGDTEFGLGWIPFGGYCKIAGMIDESMDTEAMKQPPRPWEYRSKPAWQRLTVIVGGVFMNLVAAIVIYIGISWHWGDEYIDNSDIRWGYTFNDLGREIGFRDGDRIVSFDGEPVTGSWSGVYGDMLIGQVREVGVLRDGSPVTVTIPGERMVEMLDSPGFMTPRMPFVAAEIAPGSGAEEAGMMPGDSLVALNGRAMIFFDQYVAAVGAMTGQTAAVTVIRDSVGATVRRVLNVEVSAEGKMGVGPESAAAMWFPVRTREYTLAQAIPAGFRRAGAEIGSYWRQLKLIVSPGTEAYKSVGSLITIGSIFPGTWNWLHFWTVTAFLSIILAIMNILPIPALDGGHALFLLWEVATGRRPSDKFLERATMVGLMLLMALMVLAFWNDIYRFFIK
ncbi:MAG: RIP metalloprotease RseP [Alistipes sp.]|jgi:regulator of sigma E protease|nr:RIP metalloprotease RseP [Alistipes sp.]